MRAFRQRGNVQFGVDDLNLVVNPDVAGRDLAGAVGINRHDFRMLGKELCREKLDVQNQFCNVFFHTGDGRKLMLHTLDSDAGCCDARERVQKHAAQGIAQRLTEAALQGIHNELAVSVVFADLYTFDFGVFDLIDHSAFPPLLSRSLSDRCALSPGQICVRISRL